MTTTKFRESKIFTFRRQNITVLGPTYSSHYSHNIILTAARDFVKMIYI